MKKRKPRHFNALSVGRIARYAKRDGANRCEIVAMVLFALGFGDLACRAAKFINLYDLIIPTAEIAMEAVKSFVAIRGAIATLILIATDGAVAVVIDGLILIGDAISTLPAVTGFGSVLAFLKQLNDALNVIREPLKNIQELYEWEQQYKEWYEKVAALEEAVYTKHDLDCICNAYKKLSNSAINELEKPI